MENIWTKEVTRKYDLYTCEKPYDHPWSLSKLKEVEKKIGLPPDTIRVVLGKKDPSLDRSFVRAGLDESDIFMVKVEGRLYYLNHMREAGENSRITDIWLSECSAPTLRDTLNRVGNGL